jgi:translocation and assembly module TamA
MAWGSMVALGAAALGPAHAQPRNESAGADARAVREAAEDDDPLRPGSRQSEPADDDAPLATSVFDTGVTTLEPGNGGTYRLEVRAPQPWRDLLVRHLDLARFHGQADIAPIEIARLMAATPAEARALMEPTGHFDAKVDVQRLASADGGPPTVTVRVDPGPPVRVQRVQLEIQGPYADTMNTASAPGTEAASLRRRWERVQARWLLPAGTVFSQDAWSDAKNALLGSLRTRGYANASLVRSSAEVDVASRSVQLSAVVDSGPLYRVGEVRIAGLDRTPEEAALNLLPFGIGSVYSERALLDYQEALQKAGLYEGVAVELDLQSPEPERAVIVARLREQPMQNATFSIGFSTNTGPRVGLSHTHRRIFGRDLIATTQLKYGRDERLIAFDLLTYPQPGGYRNLLGVKADYLDAGGAITQTQRVRLGRTRDTQRLDRLYYLEYNQTTLETATQRGTDRAVLANYEWVRRDVNNLVFPTRGLIISAQAGGGGARGADGERGPFGRLYLSTVAYQPLTGGWIALLRGEVAQVFKKDTLGVPDTLLFRAGGDDSVRGYGYRTLGPVRDGAVVGGPVLATGSIELMRRFSQTSQQWRDWYGAVFVDAGNAAINWTELDPALGYGVGVRWRSPIGPLRVDLAYGEQVKSVRLHLSVGVTF